MIKTYIKIILGLFLPLVVLSCAPKLIPPSNPIVYEGPKYSSLSREDFKKIVSEWIVGLNERIKAKNLNTGYWVLYSIGDSVFGDGKVWYKMVEIHMVGNVPRNSPISMVPYIKKRLAITIKDGKVECDGGCPDPY